MKSSSLQQATLACIFVLCLAAAGATQQTTPPKSPAQEAPSVRVTTRLVQVSVVVQDSRNQPITGLTRDDFTLLDAGQPQPISVFSVESSAQLTTPAAPLPPNTFTNRSEQRSGTPTSVTIILLDQINTRFGDNVYARDQVIRFLGQIQPNDRVALYTLGAGITVLHDFTADASRLVRALARHKGGEEAALTASEPEAADTGDAELDAWLNNANQRMGDFYLRNRVRTTTAAMEAIANHVARLPGRKNLVWVSGSFPISFGLDRERSEGNMSPDSGVFTDEIERATRALNNANIAIYPVDARGLVVGNRTAAMRGGSTGRGPAVNPWPGLPGLALTHDTMNTLADRTGGRAFYNTNDINASIRRAIADSRVTYVLGFYPSHNKWDGKFRDLKVRVNREGARVRHRKGYFAFAEQPPAGTESRTAELIESARSPLDAAALGITAQVKRVQAAGDDILNVTLRLDHRDVSLRQEGDRWVGAVDLLFMQRGNEGRELTRDVQTMQINVSQSRYAQFESQGILFSGRVPVAAGAEELRLVVRDTGSTAVGSLAVPFSQLK